MGWSDAFRSVRVPVPGSRHQPPCTHWVLGPPITASRNPNTPDSVDVLHGHPPLHLLNSALCSPAGPARAQARPRRCADPRRFVAADFPGNPPIRRVDLSATRHPRLRAGLGDTSRAAVGQAGSFNSGKNASAINPAKGVKNRTVTGKKLLQI